MGCNPNSYFAVHLLMHLLMPLTHCALYTSRCGQDLESNVLEDWHCFLCMDQLKLAVMPPEHLPWIRICSEQYACIAKGSGSATHITQQSLKAILPLAFVTTVRFCSKGMTEWLILWKNMHINPCVHPCQAWTVPDIVCTYVRQLAHLPPLLPLKL